MALKLGSLFADIIGKDIQEGMNKLKGAFGPSKEVEQWQKKIEVVNRIIDSSVQSIVTLKDKIKTLAEGSAEYDQALRSLEGQEKKLSVATAKYNSILKDSEDSTKNFYNSFEKSVSWSFDNILKKVGANTASLNKDFSAGAIGAKEYSQSLAAVRFVAASDVIGEFGTDVSKATKDVFSVGAKMIGSGFGKALTAMLPMLGPIVGELTKLLVIGVQKAVDQIFELNNALIGLQRNTSGIIGPAQLGADVAGNLTGSLKSLKTSVIGANIDMQQFTSSVEKLFSESGISGQIIGLKDNIKNSGESIRKYGIEAARFSKMYGADISGAVSGLMKDFGVGMDDATMALKDGAAAAKAAGLSVAAFVTNLEQVTKLAGEIYFKDGVEGMKEMAMLATKLGTNVDTLAKGVAEMSSITDLFEQQQKKAALGMGNWGKQMTRIFALRQTGQGAKAAQVELAAMARDVSQFTKSNGELDQQGIATLQASGASTEQIKIIQRLTRQSAALGVSYEKLLDPTTRLTAAQRAQVDALDRANMSFEEKFSVATQSLFQTFIDPLSQMITPVLNGLADLWLGLVDFTKPILDGAIAIGRVLNPALDFTIGLIKGLGSSIGSAFGDLGTKLSGLYEKLEPVFNFLIKGFQLLGEIVGKTIGGAFQIVGWALGKFVDMIVGIVDFFKPLIDALTAVTDGFKGWVDKWPLSVIFDGEESQKEGFGTNKQVADLLVGAETANKLANSPILEPNLPSLDAEKTLTSTRSAAAEVAVANEQAATSAFTPKIVINQNTDLLGSNLNVQF